MNKIMILGTFHMQGSCDVHGEAVKDIFSERRQKEIEELLDKIKQYQPTKIAVEVERKKDELLNQQYVDYLNQQKQLTQNEVHQIAFRLAKQLEHEKIYAIDWMEQGVSIRGCGECITYLTEKEPGLYEEISKYECEDIKLEHDTTIVDVYQKINSLEYEEMTQAYYTNYARIGVEDDYYGLGWLNWWYQRNLIIFANLSELVTQDSDERILLLIGAAHKGILSQMLRDSKVFEVVNTLEYLR